MPWDNPAMFGGSPFTEQDLGRLDPEKLRAGLLRQQGRQIGVQQMQQGGTPAEMQLDQQAVPPGLFPNFRPPPGQQQNLLPPIEPFGSAPEMPLQPPQGQMIGAGPQQQVGARPAPPVRVQAKPQVQARPVAQPGADGPSIEQMKALLGNPTLPTPPVQGVTAEQLQQGMPVPTIGQGLGAAKPGVGVDQVNSALNSSLLRALQPPGSAPLPPGFERMAGGPGVTQKVGPSGSVAEYNSAAHPEVVRAADAQARAEGRLGSFEDFAQQIAGRDQFGRGAAQMDPGERAGLMKLYQEGQRNQILGREADIKDRATTLGTAGGLEQARIQHEGQGNKELQQAKNNVYMQTYEQTMKTPGGTPEQAHSRAQEAVQRLVDSQTTLKADKANAGVQAGGAQPGVQQPGGPAGGPVVANSTDPIVQSLFFDAKGGPLNNVVKDGQVQMPQLLKSLPGVWGNLTEAQKQGVSKLLLQEGGGHDSVNSALTDAMAKRMFETGKSFGDFKLKPVDQGPLGEIFNPTFPYQLTHPMLKGGQNQKTFNKATGSFPITAGTRKQYESEAPLLAELMKYTLPR